MSDDRIEIPIVKEKITIGDIKQHVSDEIKKEFAKHPGVKIRNECLERDHAFYDQQKKNQKHEKIERMAWEYCNTNFENLKKMHNDNQSTIEHLHYCLECSWQLAEAFYCYAKEKEEGKGDM